MSYASLAALDIEYSVSGGMTKERFQTFKDRYGLKTFIETGTLVGTTTKHAAPYFDQVYTIELSEKYARKSRENLKRFPHVHVLQGRSEVRLQEILEREGAPSTLFFLDAHYSAGETAQAKNDPPVNEEFLVIKPHIQENTVIILDDIRCFSYDMGCVLRSYYPYIRDLKRYIEKNYPGFGFYIIGDQAIIYNPSYYNDEISPGVDLLTKLYTSTKKQEFVALARTIPEVLSPSEKASIYTMYDNQTPCAMIFFMKGILDKSVGNENGAKKAFQLARENGLSDAVINEIK